MKKAYVEPTTDYGGSNIKVIEGLAWDGIYGKPKKTIIVTNKTRKGTSTFIDVSLQPRHIGAEIRHVELGNRIVKKPRPPLHKPVFTSTKVSMAGFTVGGIESETSYLERTWPVFAAKELMDNAYDWFNEFYPNSPKQDRKISLHVWPINGINAIRIAVRNSNVDNIPVFQNLGLTFDLAIWYSSKRNQHKGGTGALGDALKRILKMGYASWTSSEDSFTDKQWEEPVILTFNGQQYTALLHVDTDKQDARVIINRNYNAAIEEIGNDTEVSVALPTKYDYESVLGQLRQYYRIYKIPKIRIDISLDITPPAAVIDSEIDDNPIMEAEM